MPKLFHRIVSETVVIMKRNLNQLMRSWYLSHRRPAKAQASLVRAFAVRAHEIRKKTKGPTKNQTSSPHWMAAQTRLKNAFTGDEKNHDFIRWLNFVTVRSYLMF